MFTAYKNGAEQEAEIVTRYEAGAEIEAEAAYTYKDGAEQEVWSALDVMYVHSCTLTNAQIEIKDKKRSFSFELFEDKDQSYGSLTASGSIVFAIDGNWVNPTFSFGWMGGFNYCNSTYSIFNQGSMGTVKFGYVNGNGSYTEVASISVGGQEKDSSGWILSQGDFSKDISGTVTQFRITFTPRSDLTGTYYNGSCDLDIYDVKINEEQIGFTPEAENYSKFISDY